MSKSGLAITSTALFLGIAACASHSPTASVTSIRQQAMQERMERCLKSGFTTNRHVPVLALVEGCERAVYRRVVHRQRVRANSPH